ncbi:hypothetical protein Val02_29000 [Virgisporangium aliadipatigenens]|uniref:Carbohydrate-binding domain-containing protein n=1 Tax=Virgisporangium aliadipatigenens TaxID=741659 RepID=A0A8J4DPY4_9ACTN|nr:hypothetical protein Val02_29000 [Virgisporangium aliadipatigenens]
MTAVTTVAATAAGITVAEADAQPLVAGPAAAAALAANQPSHDSTADHSWNSADVHAVTLTGSGASTTAPGVTVSGSTVTVTQAGTYRFSGTLTDGQIAVNSTGTGIVRLILNGVTVTNNTNAAVNVIAADEVMVVVADGTTNTLTDATTYTPVADDPNAALFSAADLTITGGGTLTVNGRFNDGIAGKDGLVIDSARITVTARDDGIRGQDYVIVNSGTLSVTATGDGIKSDNDEDATRGYVSLVAGTVGVTATGDGVTATTDVIKSGGTLSVKSGGGSTVQPPADGSAKGLKAGVLLILSDGQSTVDSSDDGVHSDAAIVVEGGTTTVATADDGVHAESTLDVRAGTVNVTKSYEGFEGLKVTFSGGSASAVASDDAVNAAEEGVPEMQVAPNAFIRVTGGTVVADGGTDGLDSNGTLQLTGGTVVVAGSGTRGGGEGGLDSNGALTITGGVVYSTGISASTSTLPASGQGWLRVTFAANQPAGTIVHLATTSGTQIAAYRSTKAFRQVVFSSTQITRGTSYDVYTGGSVSGTAVGGNMYTGGTLSGTRVSTVVAGR